MRSYSPFQSLLAVIILTVALCVFALAPKNSPGEMHRQLVTLTIPAGETDSNVVRTAMNGTSTIALAEPTAVSTPTLTISMENWLGNDVSTMTLASDTMATTATTTTELSSLKAVPLAGEIRFSASASGGPEEDLTVTLLILYKDEY